MQKRQQNNNKKLGNRILNKFVKIRSDSPASMWCIESCKSPLSETHSKFIRKGHNPESTTRKNFTTDPSTLSEVELESCVILKQKDKRRLS